MTGRSARPRGRPTARGGAGAARDHREGIPGVLVNPHSWTLGLVSAGIYGGFAAFVGLWGVPYLTQVYGLPRVQAANLVGLAAVGLLVDPLIGWLSDRMKRRRLPLIMVSGVNVVTWLALVGPAAPAARLSCRPPAF